MAAYQKAVSATFASAAARIRGSIDFLDNAGEPLDAWQSDMLARALAVSSGRKLRLATECCLSTCAGRHSTGRTRPLSQLSGGPTVTIAEIRNELQRVLGKQAA